MRAIIIDDESKQRELVRTMVDMYCPDIEIVAQANGVKAAQAAISEHNPDLLFLDVEMGDGTGFDLLKRVQKRNFQVIFITAHNVFALEAIKFSALDYLLKPLSPDDLLHAVQKAVAMKDKKNMQTQLSFLLSRIQGEPEKKGKIILKDADNIHIVEVERIIRLEAQNNYTEFFFAGGKKMLVSRPLKYYEQMLPENIFFRNHRSHLFNLHFLARIDKRLGGFIVLKDNTELPLSMRKKDRLLTAIEKI